MTSQANRRRGPFRSRAAARPDDLSGEDRFRRAFEDAAIGMCLSGLDGRFLLANEALARVLGRDREQLAGLGLTRVAHETDAERIAAALRTTVEGGLPSFTIDARLVRGDGRVAFVLLTATLVRNGGGAPVYFLVQAQDVTDQKETEAALVEAEERYRLLVEDLPLVTYAEETTGGVWSYYISPQAQRVLGIAPEEYAEMSWERFYQMIHPADRDRLREEIERFYGDPLADCASEYRLIRPDGRTVWIRDVAVADRDSHGAPVRARGFMLDITEQKRTEEALRRRDDILDAVSVVGRLLVEQPLSACGPQLLAVLGEAVGASRAHLLQIDVANGEHIAVDQLEWCAPGIAPDPWPAVSMEGGGIERWAELFRQREPVHGSVAAMPRGEWLASEPGNVRSLAIVPILVGADLWGAVGFDDCETERAWLPAELDALRAAAAVIGAAIGRQRAEQALRQSEEMLRQSQKMEAIGRLAGGVAHDFNNLLTVITGYGGLLLDQLQPGDPLRADVEQIAEAAGRAVTLTGQLLAFSRRQVLEWVPVDVNEVVCEVESMLRRLIGEDVELAVVPGRGLEPVSADPGQLQQVVVNLVVNARDAMPDGGTLTIRTGILEVADEAPPLRLRPGRHVWLSVADTGLGMDEGTRAQVFEPFFTTKEKGRGTGLGLSTVFGIVKQSGGEIAVDSAPGKGSTFTVYLPARTAGPSDEASTGGACEPGGSETILLAEDEDIVRTLVVTVLEGRGYTVLAARDGTEALELAERHAGSVDLLVTDVVMPRMSGRELAERVRSRCPSLPVVYVSGYTDDAFLRRGVPEPDAPFLQKPFTADTLATVVRTTLDTARAA